MINKRKKLMNRLVEQLGKFMLCLMLMITLMLFMFVGSISIFTFLLIFITYMIVLSAFITTLFNMMDISVRWKK